MAYGIDEWLAALDIAEALEPSGYRRPQEPQAPTTRRRSKQRRYLEHGARLVDHRNMPRPSIDVLARRPGPDRPPERCEASGAAITLFPPA